MNTNYHFRPHEIDQLYLLPEDLRSWLSDDHLVYFIIDVVKQLDLKGIYSSYSPKNGGGPAYHPAMMTSLLFYGYCTGMISSRKIEKATWENVAMRVLARNQHPDHDTIAYFRKRHLEQLKSLFVQVFRLCQEAGLVKLGHVALDGTKIQANASKHKAMSYGRMVKKETELEADVKKLLKEAEEMDKVEDKKYGKGKRGDELPEDLRHKQSRLAKIKAAKAVLEEEAKKLAVAKESEYQAKKKAHEDRGGRGKPPSAPSDQPADKKQYNFTDPQSRIMKAGGSNHFVQAYNCQATVDEGCQIIVAAHVTQDANDKKQLERAVEEIKKNTGGGKPDKMTADAGYFSESNCQVLENENIDGYIATGKQKHGEKNLSPQGSLPKEATVKEKMAQKLITKEGRDIYSKRKYVVEPVFGQIKEARGFRRFSLRGYVSCAAEWDIVCTAHNLMKLFRYGWNPA